MPLEVVERRGGGVGPARGNRPALQARLRLLDRPSGRLLAPVVPPALRLLVVILTHMSGFQPVPGCIRCVIYTRISKDALGDGHGIANQLADLEKRATARGWTVVYRLSDNDIGVTRKDATAAGKRRAGYEEVLRLVDAREVDVVLCWRWDR